MAKAISSAKPVLRRTFAEILESETLAGDFLAKVDKKAKCLFPVKFSIKKGRVNKKKALRRLTEGDWDEEHPDEETAAVLRPTIEASKVEFEAIISFCLPEDITPKTIAFEVLYSGPKNSKKKWQWYFAAWQPPLPRVTCCAVLCK